MTHESRTGFQGEYYRNISNSGAKEAKHNLGELCLGGNVKNTEHGCSVENKGEEK